MAAPDTRRRRRGRCPWLLPGRGGGAGRRLGHRLGPGRAPTCCTSAVPQRRSEELPDPAGAVLWAHAFAATAVHTTGSRRPGRDRHRRRRSPAAGWSRRRRLRPQTSYIAALVPTLAASALAGLGALRRGGRRRPRRPAAELRLVRTRRLGRAAGLPALGVLVRRRRRLREPGPGAARGSGRPTRSGPGRSTSAWPAPGCPRRRARDDACFRGALTAPGIADEAAWPDPTDADQAARRHARSTAEIAAAAADRPGDAGAPRPAGGRPAALRARRGRPRLDVGRAEPGHGLVRPAQPRPAGTRGRRHRHPRAAPQRRGRDGREPGSRSARSTQRTRRCGGCRPRGRSRRASTSGTSPGSRPGGCCRPPARCSPGWRCRQPSPAGSHLRRALAAVAASALPAGAHLARRRRSRSAAGAAG